MLEELRREKLTRKRWSRVYARLFKSTPPNPDPSEQARRPFLDSLRTLRQEVENYLGPETPLFTVANPSFLDRAQLLQLSKSLADANIHDSYCHSPASSSRAALWSHRLALSRWTQSKTVAECVHGDLGGENVIFIEHEEKTLTLEGSKSTWATIMQRLINTQTTAGSSSSLIMQMITRAAFGEKLRLISKLSFSPATTHGTPKTSTAL